MKDARAQLVYRRFISADLSRAAQLPSPYIDLSTFSINIRCNTKKPLFNLARCFAPRIHPQSSTPIRSILSRLVSATIIARLCRAWKINRLFINGTCDPTCCPAPLFAHGHSILSLSRTFAKSRRGNVQPTGSNDYWLRTEIKERKRRGTSLRSALVALASRRRARLFRSRRLARDLRARGVRVAYCVHAQLT